MRIYLVRHASHDLIGQMLCGRSVDPEINEDGRQQAGALADSLLNEPIDLVHTSPRRRARETARTIADLIGCPCEVTPALDEIHLGDWEGRSFEALAADSRWHSWNTHRGSATPPDGESMVHLQRRVLSHLEKLARLPIRGAVLVSHAEPIRAVLMHFRGIALDDFHQVDVAAASISILDLPTRTEITPSESLVA